MRTATALATPNIALVKYWGKRDEDLKLPKNSSLSVTLDENLRTVTKVSFRKSLRQDEVFLNGKKLPAGDARNASKVLDFLRAKAGSKLRARIESRNHFPEGAGLASSASGYAALAFAAAKALQLKLSARELSIAARIGSGSACRSTQGGIVEWVAGKKRDGSDSYGRQLFGASHWPQLRDVIAMVEEKKKKVSSRQGMTDTVRTSKLFAKRLRELPARMRKIKEALKERRLGKLLDLVMEESDSMHACMADTRPPLIYLNGNSVAMIIKVMELNHAAGRTIAGYTFDAGPNAHVITVAKQVPVIVKALKELRSVKKIIVCGVGRGPRAVR